MKTFFFFLCAVITFAITGCATSVESRLLKRGDLAEAYVFNVSGGIDSKAEEKNRVIDEILSKTGGAKDEKFQDMLTKYMNGRRHDESFFSTFLHILDQALKDRLISSSQFVDLKDKLLYMVAKASIDSPNILQNKIIKDAFPELKKVRVNIALGELMKLKIEVDASLSRYIPIYIMFKELNDEAATEQVRLAMHEKAQSQLKSENKVLGTNITYQPFLEYIKVTGDRSLDAPIVDALMKVKLSRSDLSKGDIPNLFPNFSSEKIQKSIIRLNITSPNDEFVVGEVIQELKKANEWLEVSEDAKRKLTIGRIRFQETRNNPMNATQTVQSPSFMTLLFIPKNASVLFDYSKSEYALQWNMSILDSHSKISKVISGQRKEVKVECNNMRYQNVFGGTGALDFMPNDDVARFCQSSANVDFEKTRASAINAIAKEIDSSFIAVN
jgi:hypothetical protein